MKRDKNKRRRVSSDEVRANAKSGGGGARWFTLPDGVREWTPGKAGTYVLDFLPYEVKDPKHPDKIEPGCLWYKRGFQVHRNVGSANESMICPTSVGKPCPICQYRDKLAKDWDENEELIKAIRTQKFVVYTIKDPDDSEKFAVFAYSRAKFAQVLEKELEEGDDSILNFYDVTDDGKTLVVRFSDASYEGRRYLETTRIDFKSREEMDEDEIIAAVPCLDEIFNVETFDRIKEAFFQLDAKAEAPAKGKDKPAKGKSKKPDLEEEEEEPEDEDEEADEEPAKGKAVKKPAKPAFKIGDKVSITVKGKKIAGKVVDVDEDDISVEDANGKEYDVASKDVTAGGKAAKEEPEEEDEEDEEEEEEPEEKPAKGKAAAKKKPDPEEEEEPDEDEEEPDADGPAKVGDEVTFTDEESGKKIAGKVIHINAADDATVKTAKGSKYTVDIDELTVTERGEPDDEEPEEEEEEDDEEPATKPVKGKVASKKK